MSASRSQHHTVYLGLGTNLGDRPANLRRALQQLAVQMTLVAISPVYVTEPWGLRDQPDYLNLAVVAKTGLPPRALLHFLKEIEQKIGRIKGLRWGPRLIDIDILFYDDLVYVDDQLTIPHPHVAERAFVLGPLNDIAGSLRHPETGVAVAAMAAALDLSTLKPAGFSLDHEPKS